MGIGELLFLGILALLVFGPRKLPEMARTLAKVMAELRRASNEFRYSLEDEIRNIEVSEQGQMRGRPAAGPAKSLPSAVPGVVARPDEPAPAPEPPPGPLSD